MVVELRVWRGLQSEADSRGAMRDLLRSQEIPKHKIVK